MVEWKVIQEKEIKKVLVCRAMFEKVKSGENKIVL